jgi:hypothetical protein
MKMNLILIIIGWVFFTVSSTMESPLGDYLSGTALGLFISSTILTIVDIRNSKKIWSVKKVTIYLSNERTNNMV